MGGDDLRWRGLTPRSIVDPTGQIERSPAPVAGKGPTFDEILKAQLPAGTVQLSAEAKESLQTAGIDLTPMDLDRVGKGIDRLAESGGQTGLLIGDKTAMVVDVSNRIVTHASARQEARDHVFSEVDSVMLLD